MISNSRQFGGALPIILVSVLAALIVGGTYLFMSAPPSDAQAQDSGVKPNALVQVERPEVDGNSIPRVSPDADKIMKGELIKYRDENGTTHFRVRQPFEGVMANGQTTYWHLDAFLGPQVNSLAATDKSRFQRSVKPKPPVLAMKDGKFVPAGKNK